MTTGFDPATPNTARVYSRLLGGKDHFPADRAEADLLLEIYPPLAEMVQENRSFLAQAVTWAAGEGIGQFLDLGAGLPATPAIHQIARAVLPTARVAYVDTEKKMAAWQRHGAILVYLSSHRRHDDIRADESVIRRHGFPAGPVHGREQNEDYGLLARLEHIDHRAQAAPWCIRRHDVQRPL